MSTCVQVATPLDQGEMRKHYEPGCLKDEYIMCIENCLNVSAFCDLWAEVMF